MTREEKPIVWLGSEVKTPPFSKEARIEAGYLLRMLQRGHRISLPHSRAMRTVGVRCHELRINDAGRTFRIVYRVDSDAIVIAEVFTKRTTRTPDRVIETARRRLREYDRLAGGMEK